MTSHGRSCGQCVHSLSCYARFYWKRWIYRRAFKSIGRLCDGNPGFAYLLRFWLDNWIEQHPVLEEAQNEAKAFYKSVS